MAGWFGEGTITNLRDAKKDPNAVELLDLSGKGLAEIPDALFAFVNLRKLTLAKNRLKKVPSEIARLSKLESLSLIDNQLDELPDAIGQLLALRKLDLDKNNFVSIPPVVTKLKHLTSLSIANSKPITKSTKVPGFRLDGSIGGMKALETLVLGGNGVAEIPDAISKLTNLQKLELRASALQGLPECLAKLTTLKSLDLRFTNAMSGGAIPAADVAKLRKKLPGCVIAV